MSDQICHVYYIKTHRHTKLGNHNPSYNITLKRLVLSEMENFRYVRRDRIDIIDGYLGARVRAFYTYAHR